MRLRLSQRCSHKNMAVVKQRGGDEDKAKEMQGNNDEEGAVVMQ